MAGSRSEGPSAIWDLAGKSNVWVMYNFLCDVEET